jgi:arylsulfatase A-like enzyme
LLLMALASCSSSQDARPDPPTRIALIVIDTLRADALPFHGADPAAAPFLGELAERSLVFERAWAASSWTAPSTASIFTSRYPNQHGVEYGLRARRGEDGIQSVAIKRLPEFLETIPVFLRSRGYATFGLSANLNIGQRLGFDRGFDHFERLAYRKGNDATSLVSRAIAWKAQLLARPSFLYLHLMDPHRPYERHEQWVAADAPAPDEDGGQWVSYQSEVRFVDEALGRLFEALDLMDALVFVTSDHGQEFGDHGGTGHGFQLYSELTHVPLLVQLPGPGARSGRIPHDVSNLDILPTLRFLLGEDPAPGDAGRSLLPLSELGPSREIFAMRRADDREARADKLAVLQGRFKLILTEPEGRAELYDLLDDPAEIVDKAAAAPERVQRLREALTIQARDAGPPLQGFPDAYRPSADEARMLEELGYVEEGT